MAKKMQRNYVALKSEGPGGLVIAASMLLSTSGCLKWIATSGDDGATYQPASFNGPPVTVQVETVSKRRLSTDVPKPSSQ